MTIRLANSSSDVTFLTVIRIDMKGSTDFWGPCRVFTVVDLFIRQVSFPSLQNFIFPNNTN